MDYYSLSDSQTEEVKTCLDHLSPSLYETYSSFCNTKGGTIYLGITEKKAKNIIVGVKNVSELKKEFVNAIHNKAKVSVAVGGDEIWQEYLVDGKTIVAITIPEAPLSLKPVYLNGNPAFSYIRGADGDFLAN